MDPKFQKLFVLVIAFVFTQIGYTQLSDLHYLPPLKQDSNNVAIQQQTIYLSTPEVTTFTVNVFQGTNPTAIASLSLSKSSPIAYGLGNGDNNITLVNNGNTGSVLTSSGLKFEAPGGQKFYVNYRGRSGSQAASITSKGRAALGQIFKWGGAPIEANHPSMSATLGIMATEDNTEVTISGYNPNCEFRLGGTIDGITANSLTFILEAGESYVLEASKDATTANIDGWIGASIVSDKDIAISNGMLNFGVNPSSGSRDAGADQPVPEDKLGKEYVFVRGNGGVTNEFVVIIGTQANTNIYVNGSATAYANIGVGDYVEIPSSFYSGTTVGHNMFVSSTKDVYAYQVISGDTGIHTVSLNFVAPVNCLMPDTMDFIHDIEDISGITAAGGLFIIASTTTANADITVTDGTGVVTLPAEQTVAGSPDWKTFYLSGLTGNVSVVSTGPVAVGFLGFNGARGIAGYFSGFDTVPVIDLEVVGGGCLPGATVEVVDKDFETYQWFDDGVLVPGATNPTYDPTDSGDYFVRVTKGGCTYDSQPISAYYCTPDIVLNKTADKTEVLVGDMITFVITVESRGLYDVTNVNVNDVLPAGLSISTINVSTGSWSAPNWTVGTLTSGQIETITIEAVANEILGLEQRLDRTNTASNSQDQTDSNNTTEVPSVDFSILRDIDDDGVADQYDLDDDNDGILDTTESNGSDPNADSDSDGVPNYLDANFCTLNADSICANLDIDNDGIPNHMDLDSDGDGIPDNIEAQLTTNYTAPNTDTASDYITNNGLNSAYIGGLSPENTDGADTPDYLDTNADNDSLNDTAEAGIALSGVDTDNDGLDDGTDANTSGYTDPGGTIDDPITGPLALLDSDNDANSGGDVDFRDTLDNRPDNDNDGIVDAEDFDDDNDGILDTDEGCGNLVINGSFEAQDFSDPIVFPDGFTDTSGTFIGATYNSNTLYGWNYTQNIDGWIGGQSPSWSSSSFATAYSGNQYIDVVGSNNVTGGVNGILSQVINTIPGNSYTFSFHWGEDVGHGNGAIITLDVDVLDAANNPLINETITATAQGPIAGVIGPRIWYYYSQTFTATTTETRIQFRATPPAGSSSAGADIDYVSVVNTGGCQDSDNDGVIDAFDLDSDNDGIYDAVEAGHNQPHTNGEVNGAVGVDGVPNAVQDDPDRETINYTVADSDGDITIDAQELDADDDGCNDVNEAGFTDGDANGLLGSGTFGSGLAVNSNGVVTSGSDGYTTPADANSNTIYDYTEAGSLPTITSQPLDISVYETESASFSVVTSGSNLTYQWQESTDDGVTFNNLSDTGIYSGAHTANLVITGVTTSIDNNKYRVIINNVTYACGSITSTVATITVLVDIDTDGDGIFNRIDLDDDNDGIPDLEESQCEVSISPGVPPSSNAALSLGSRLYTDFNSYWTSAVGAINPLKPDNTSNLLAFEIGSQTYATGVVNSRLIDSDNDGLFDALDTDGNGIGDVTLVETSWTALTPVRDINTGIRLEGSALDGNTAAAVGPLLTSGGAPFNPYLNQGVRGLNLAYSIANIGDVWYFNIQGILSSAYGDGIQDILVTQVAQPGGSTFNTLHLIDNSGNFIGNGVTVNWNTVSSMGNHLVDQYNTNDSVSGSNQSKGIRFAAIELSEFNLTPAEIANAVALRLEISSDADPAFFVVNDASFLSNCVDVDSDFDGIPDSLDLDSDNDGIYDLEESGALNVSGVNDSNNDGVIDGPASSFGDNGLFTLIENNDTSGASITYSISDSDSDSVYDAYELDADNDSCNDVDEAGFTDGDSNGLLGSGTFGSGLTVNLNGVVTSGSDGYTTPDDLNTNNTYDFQEAGAIPVITDQPTDDSICYGDNARFEVVVTGSNLIYQWQVSTDGGFTFADISNSSVYNGATAAVLNVITPVQSFHNYQYRVTISDSAFSCGSVISETAVLTVQVQPNAGNNGALHLCEDDIATLAQLQAAITSEDAGGIWSPALAPNVTTYTYTVAATSPCTTDDASIVLVTYQAQPNAGNHGTLDLCVDGTATIAQLQAAITGEDAGGTWSPALSPNVTTYAYTVAATSPCSTEDTSTVTVNYVAPTIAISNGPICSLDLLTYSVEVTVSGGLVTSTEGTVTSTSGNNWTISGINTGTNVTLTVTDTCTNSLVVTAPNCSCPVVAAPSSGGDDNYCAGESIPTLTANVGLGETVDWYAGSTVGIPLLSGNTSYIPSGSGTFYAEARLIVNGCTSTSRTLITLTENPLPAAPVSGGNQTECATFPIQTLTATATTPTGSNLVWYDAANGGNVVASPTLNTVGTIIYYAGSTDSTTNCESASRTVVALTIEDCDADLSLKKTVDNSIPAVGDDISFSITLRNDGPSAANAIIIRDIIPSDFNYTHPNFSTSQGTVTFNSGTGALTWDLGSYVLSSGGSLTLVYTVTVNVCGEFVNKVEVVSSSQSDTDSTPSNGG
ncbi:Ig-like domain-containing protein [Aureibaculum luteum]|uniref:Ig-like domain-containing protein n=1 Tax=Aureibaculum luteum TaxID=1548456 RepID=UPI001E50BD69|nr:hypothetical protein [Aureibaculum luteum]